MTFVIQENSTGWQPIASTETSAKHPLGTIVKASDPTLGSGEFIYLKGVASTVVGSWVKYNMDDGSTALLTAGDKGLVAISMSANVANQYGWYQVTGKASGSAADVDSGRVFIDTIPGTADDAVVIGDQVQNARWVSADDTATARAEVAINRPFTMEPST